MEDEQLSTNYGFHDVGIRLWREEAFHPKLLKDASYMKDRGHMIDEMVRYRFFDLVAVGQCAEPSER